MQITEIRVTLDPRAEGFGARRERPFTEQINEFRRLLPERFPVQAEHWPADGEGRPSSALRDEMSAATGAAALERPCWAREDLGLHHPADGTRVSEDQPAANCEAPLLDPLELAMAAPVGLPLPHNPDAGPRGASVLDPLVSELVRSLAWGGDRRRGAARLELGGKRFGGASVVVHAEEKEIALEVTAPAHADAQELGERLRERFEARGLTVRNVTVK